MKNSQSNVMHQTLILSASFVFAYFFGVILHEIGHTLAYAYYGIPTDIFVIHPFGRNYMEPAREVSSDYLHIVYMAGTLFNIICATIIYLILKQSKNASFLPLILLGSTSFIQESIGITLDLVSGDAFDWSIVAQSGIPIGVIVSFAIFLLVIGCWQFLSIFAKVGVSKSNSFSKVLQIALSIVTPFFLMSLIYVSFFEPPKLEAKIISLFSSVVLGTMLALIYHFKFDTSRTVPLNIMKSHAQFSVFLTFSLILFGLLFYN